LSRVGKVQVSLASFDEIERDTVTGYRWWSLCCPARPSQ
jgi:hypothetical protein